LRIIEDDLTGGLIAALLSEHLKQMHALTPAESVHALDLDNLRSPGITFWSAWESDVLLGCGALLELDTTRGEIKSMRTAEEHRGKGVASALLRHIIREAGQRRYRWLLLETSSMEEFTPARQLYGRHGFSYRGPFAEYVEDPNSVFMTLDLQNPNQASFDLDDMNSRQNSSEP